MTMKNIAFAKLLKSFCNNGYKDEKLKLFLYVKRK